MYKKIKGRKLGRKTAHRSLMLSNLVMSLFQHERIRTTVPRAKEAAILANRLITVGRKGTVHARRMASKVICQNDILKKLFDDIAKRNMERSSGHTRILRLNSRFGDAAEMAYLELVDRRIEVADADDVAEVEDAQKETVSE